MNKNTNYKSITESKNFIMSESGGIWNTKTGRKESGISFSFASKAHGSRECYRSRLTINDKFYYLGLFETIEEAIAARDKAGIEPSEYWEKLVHNPESLFICE